ncbi:transposase [Streptomyces violascens]|uniref:transposase n=1 Tax=Streptomyces violascens TaxID=67381 RepID=UPI0036993F54
MRRPGLGRRAGRGERRPPCFTSADKLCSWAGLTPRHYESDTLVRRGHVTKQGSKLLRRQSWTRPAQGDPQIAEDRARIEAHRGRNIAKSAAARKR